MLHKYVVLSLVGQYTYTLHQQQIGSPVPECCHRGHTAYSTSMFSILSPVGQYSPPVGYWTPCPCVGFCTRTLLRHQNIVETSIQVGALLDGPEDVVQSAFQRREPVLHQNGRQLVLPQETPQFIGQLVLQSQRIQIQIR